MRQFIKKLWRDERGVSALEYAILAAIVVSAVAAAGSVLSNSTTGLPGVFTSIMTMINGKVSSTGSGSGTTSGSGNQGGNAQ